MHCVFVFGVLVSAFLAPKDTKLAAKDEAVIDYEAGEDENAADPAASAIKQDNSRDAQLTKELASERTWEDKDNSADNTAVKDVVALDKKDTSAKKESFKRTENTATQKASALDEAKLDAEFGESDSTADNEQTEVKVDEKKEDAIDAEVNSERKFVVA